MTERYTNILEKGGKLKKLLAASVVALALGATLATPSWAAVNGDDRNLEVDYSLEFVLLEGYPTNTDIKVDVIRNGVTIGTFTGQASEPTRLNAPSTLEINHVGGGQYPNGDCWNAPATPDILPGDKIQATVGDPANGDVDYTFVRDLTFTEDTASGNVSGYARGVENAGDFDVTAPLTLGIDDFLEAKRVAATTERVFIEPAAADGTFNNVNVPGSGGDVTLQYVKASAGVNAVESTVAGPDGPTGGPATPECPALAQTAITSVTPNAINLANATSNVTVSGVVQNGATVSLAMGANSYPVNSANGTWTATIAAADLQQGSNSITATFSGPGAPGPQTRTITKDTEAPGLATATPGGGLSNTTQHVSLGLPAGENGAQIRYTRGTGNFPDPTANSGTIYNNQQIEIASSETIKTIVVDAAGNPGSVATFNYTIDRDAPSLIANLGTGSYNGTQSVTLNSEVGATIRYTMGANPASPTATTGTVYNGAIPVSSTQTIKAIAIDQAGNSSNVMERTITIRKATTTSLNVATKELKLGKSRTISGVVSPAQPAGSKVKLVVRKPGKDVVKSLRLVNSRYSFTYKPPTTGRYKVQVSFVQDADSLASKSVVKSFKVIR